MATMGIVQMLMVSVLVTAGLSHTHAQPIKCSTPNSLEGECIFRSQCPSYMAIQNSSTLTQQDIAFLRRSQCDYEELEPRVCCAISTRKRPFELPDGHLPKLPPLEDDFLVNRFKPDNGLPGLKECGRQASGNKIFNGEFTGIDEFPWMALLEYNTIQASGHGFACGGALITKQHILTAAHCVTGHGEKLLGGLKSVRLGEHNIETEIDCDAIYVDDCADKPIDMKIAKTIVHPDYDEDSMDQMHDIAVIKMAGTVEFTDFVKPICMSSQLPNAIHAAGHFQFVAGWGETEKGTTSLVKKKLKVPIVEEEACASKYRNFNIKIGPRQLCAGGEAAKDSCGGDSGGPLMVQAVSPTEGAIWYMTGVVSIGPSPCAVNKIPGVYTKVFDYLDWILEVIKKG